MYDLLWKIQTLLSYLLEKMDQNRRWLKFNVKSPTSNWPKDRTSQSTMLGNSLLSQTTVTQPSSFCLEHCYYLVALHWAHNISVAVSRNCLHSWSLLQWKLLEEQRDRIGGHVAVFLLADPNLLDQRGERCLDIQLTITFAIPTVINVGKRSSRCFKVLLI